MLRQISLTLLASMCCAAAADGPPAKDPDRVEVPPDPRPDCIEAVVRARFVEYRPRELGPLAEDEIVMSWTWDVDVDVREVYVGDIQPGRLTIGATLHTEFNHDLHEPVLFLTHKFGTWYLSYIEFAARGRDGRYVVPLFDAPAKEELSPQGWLPHDYGKWLVPVSYRARDVEAFAHQYRYDETPDFEDEWVRVRESRGTAKRGYAVKDIPSMLAERRSLDCFREP
jgi:hypothetical protein